MPYRRKTYPRRRRRVMKKKPVMSLTKRVMKLQRQLAPEVKFQTKDFTATQVNWDASFSNFNLFDPVQGSAFDEFVGRKIRVKSVEIRGVYGLQTGSAGSILRTVMYIEKDRQSAPISPSDMFLGVGTQLAPVSQFVPNFRYQWIKKLDKTQVLDNVNTESKNFIWRIPINKTLIFDVGGTQLLKNSLNLIMISNRDTATPSQVPLVEFSVRVYYTDV